MKSMKRISLLAVLLAAAMMLGSCGLFGGGIGELSLEELLDEELAFDPDFVPGSLSELTGMPENIVDEESLGSLFYVRGNEGGYDTHMVYNLDTGAAVLTLADGEGEEYEVSLEQAAYSYDRTEAYVRVLKTARRNLVTQQTTHLYDAAGTQFAEAKGDETADESAELLYFDGTYYKVDRGSIAKLCEWDVLAGRPAPTHHVGDFYFEIDTTSVTVYDASLKKLHTYAIPSYAEVLRDAVIPLPSGAVLLQYLVRLPGSSTEYTAILNGGMDGEPVPVNVVTLLLDAETGEPKELDCGYVFEESELLDEVAEREFGISADRYGAVIVAVEIKDGQLSEDPDMKEMVLLFADHEGNMERLASLKGAAAIPYHCATGRWELETVDRERYLVNGKGEVIGEITQRGRMLADQYIECDGKIYDFDLKLLLDYKDRDLTRASLEGNGVLYFTNMDGDFLSWAGSGDPTVVLSHNATAKTLRFISDSLYAICDLGSDSAELYSVGGALLLTLDTANFEYHTLATTRDAEVISVTNGNGDTVYYRLSR